MKNSRIRKILVFLVILAVSGCGNSIGQKPSPLIEDITVGGLAGGALGAGTGALVGSLIKNGDVAASAMLGAAIGAPIGMIVKTKYRDFKDDMKIASNYAKIRERQKLIEKTELEIREAREKMHRESMMFEPDPDLRGEYIYTGPTLGIPQ
ncbi:MAG: hypothetical protein D6719_03360 [Candidatus Dadabacteria bacterium]|nr:MAG: hypothetical protein D6719_03360 [Candidatus Dadabacteria bacterium]